MGWKHNIIIWLEKVADPIGEAEVLSCSLELVKKKFQWQLLLQEDIECFTIQKKKKMLQDI